MIHTVDKVVYHPGHNIFTVLKKYHPGGYTVREGGMLHHPVIKDSIGEP